MDFVKRAMPADAYKPTATLGALRNGGAMNANPAFAAASQREFGLDYYLRSALAGGICCGFTHGAVTPVDVVKVRVRELGFDFLSRFATSASSRRKRRRLTIVV